MSFKSSGFKARSHFDPRSKFLAVGVAGRIKPRAPPKSARPAASGQAYRMASAVSAGPRTARRQTFHRSAYPFTFSCVRPPAQETGLDI